MKYKVGGIYKLKNDPCALFVTGEHLRITRDEDQFIYYESLDGTKSCAHYITKIDLEPVTNRSKVGKKAFKTFIKNGGSRNSKGQFGKKQELTKLKRHKQYHVPVLNDTINMLIDRVLALEAQL
jgi:hypothetical protein